MTASPALTELERNLISDVEGEAALNAALKLPSDVSRLLYSNMLAYGPYYLTLAGVVGELDAAFQVMKQFPDVDQAKKGFALTAPEFDALKEYIQTHLGEVEAGGGRRDYLIYCIRPISTDVVATKVASQLTGSDSLLDYLLFREIAAMLRSIVVGALDDSMPDSILAQDIIIRYMERVRHAVRSVK